MKIALVTAALAVIAAFPFDAFAQSRSDDEAATAFSKGVKLFKAEKYDEAVKAFRRAYELKPAWKIKFNIGQCEGALKRYGLAIEAFEDEVIGIHVEPFVGRALP